MRITITPTDNERAHGLGDLVLDDVLYCAILGVELQAGVQVNDIRLSRVRYTDDLYDLCEKCHGMDLRLREKIPEQRQRDVAAQRAAEQARKEATDAATEQGTEGNNQQGS